MTYLRRSECPDPAFFCEAGDLWVVIKERLLTFKYSFKVKNLVEKMLPPCWKEMTSFLHLNLSSFFNNKLDKLIIFASELKSMKISDYIAFTIDRFPRGYVFTYADFTTGVNQKEAVIKALNRMVACGKIAKLSKGKYYKPEITPFGNLVPDQKQIVKDLLEENGKITGYLTGYSIYNQLGLSTQLSNIIQIGKKELRPGFTREPYIIAFIKQKNTITKENIPLLQLLDAIRYIKKIPDASVEFSCKRYLAIIKNLSEREINSLVRLAIKYPPATRALLGALLEQLKKNNATKLLFDSLNPITKYKLAGAANVLTSTVKWNIV